MESAYQSLYIIHNKHWILLYCCEDILDLGAWMHTGTDIFHKGLVANGV